MNVLSYSAEECPLCRSGSKPIKPGSRKIWTGKLPFSICRSYSI
jgi:hypothetical protein